MGRAYSGDGDVLLMADEDGSSGVTSSNDDERIIYFAGEVSESNVSSAIAALFSMQARSPDPVYMVIETYGGYVDSMYSLYDAIKYVTCPVHTIALGKVMSAGVLLLAAGAKGHRLIGPHARIMTHSASFSVNGNIFEIKNELDEALRMEEMWIDAMVEETGASRDTLVELNNRRGDQYITPQKCIELGIADRLMYEPSYMKNLSVTPKHAPKGRR